MDMNDRALRRIARRRRRQDATAPTAPPASSSPPHPKSWPSSLSPPDRDDLRRRLAAIVIGETARANPSAPPTSDATGGMMALLADAILPNLVQTTEGTPALVHAGPFGNIAHGTSSILSQQMGLRLADYVVNEAGFAADLGAEKYIDIVMRASGIQPAAAVLVTTVQSLAQPGRGRPRKRFPQSPAPRRESARLRPPHVVAINRFPHDTDEELEPSPRSVQTSASLRPD